MGADIAEAQCDAAQAQRLACTGPAHDFAKGRGAAERWHGLLARRTAVCEKSSKAAMPPGITSTITSSRTA